jgi:hypothetical protein
MSFDLCLLILKVNRVTGQTKAVSCYGLGFLWVYVEAVEVITLQTAADSEKYHLFLP